MTKRYVSFDVESRSEIDLKGNKMDDNAAMKYAWDQLCEKLDAKDWTIGEKFPRECFFIHGWNARTAWDAHQRREFAEDPPENR